MTVNELIEALTQLSKKGNGDLDVVDENDQTIGNAEYNNSIEPPVIILVTE